MLSPVAIDKSRLRSSSARTSTATGGSVNLPIVYGPRQIGLGVEVEGSLPCHRLVPRLQVGTLEAGSVLLYRFPLDT